MATKPVKRPAYRDVFVPWIVRKGTPVPMPLFGPASLTHEDAQRRLDEAMASGAFVEGSGEVHHIKQKSRRRA